MPKFEQLLSSLPRPFTLIRLVLMAGADRVGVYTHQIELEFTLIRLVVMAGADRVGVIEAVLPRAFASLMLVCSTFSDRSVWR